MNEGLAEYFGEALWTGDGFVSGLIPRMRLEDIRSTGIKKDFKPFKELAAMTNKVWVQDLTTTNYDEAWVDGAFSGQWRQRAVSGAVLEIHDVGQQRSGRPSGVGRRVWK